MLSEPGREALCHLCSNQGHFGGEWRALTGECVSGMLLAYFHNLFCHLLLDNHLGLWDTLPLGEKSYCQTQSPQGETSDLTESKYIRGIEEMSSTQVNQYN